jgi:hypothetical protein
MSPERQVKVTLVIDEKGAVKAMRSAGEESGRTEGKLSKLDKSVHKLGGSFGGLKSMIGMGLGALGVGGLAFGLSSVANKTKEIATETEKFHAITGIGASSSLAYSQALKARGLSGETVTKAFGFLAKNMKSAELQETKYALSQGTAAAKGKASTAVLGRQAQALKELGINLAGFNQLTEQQKLEKITKSFEALAPGMKKTRLERELFGRGGNQLSTVLEHNNLGLSHQIDLVKKFFPTIKGGANAMNELLEKQAESKMAWEGLEFTLGQKLIPVMTDVMGWFSKVTLEVEHGKGAWGQLGSAISGVVGFLKGIWTGFESIVGPAKAVEIVVGGLVAAMVVSKVAAFGAAFGPLGLEIAGIAAGIYGAKKALEALGITKRAESLIDTMVKHPQVITASSLKELPSKQLSELQHMARVDPEKKRYPKELFKSPSQIAADAQHEAGASASAMAKVERQYNNPAPQHLVAEVHMDSVKVAEALFKNPRAVRLSGELMTKAALQMAARGPGAR